MKQCNKCKEIKSLTGFYTDRSKPDGLTTYCKPCKNEGIKKYRETDAGRTVQRKANAKYRATEAGKAVQRKAHTKQRKLYPEKYKARKAVECAIRYGKMTPPDTCSICWHDGKIEAHHPDYAKPLEIEWVCRPCHLAIHQMEVTT